jgi:hypothetical protein
VLTHLERARVEYLYNIKKLSFDSAKSQAVKEVLKAFGFENTGIKRAEKVGVVGISDDSKILLAISTLMQGYRTESEVTQIMNDFANDIKKDGTLDDATIGNDLETHLYYTDTTAVLNNFKVKYRKLYNADTVNSVDMRFVKNFQNNTTYAKDKDLISYPDKHNNENIDNILKTNLTTYSFSAQPYDRFFGVSAQILRKGMKLKIVILDENGNQLLNNSGGSSFWAPTSFTSRGWATSSLDTKPSLVAKEIGSYDRIMGFDVDNLTLPKKIKINFYERDLTTPSKSLIVTMQR